jgi:RNA polymerase primary sigma factor
MDDLQVFHRSRHEQENAYLALFLPNILLFPGILQNCSCRWVVKRLERYERFGRFETARSNSTQPKKEFHMSATTTRPAAPSRSGTRKVKRAARTFRKAKLESAFLEFCQLSTETTEDRVTKSEFEAICQQADNFILSEEFSAPSAESEILGGQLLDDCRSEDSKPASKRVTLPTHLAGLCEEHLLSPEQERLLFRRMNYLRFVANRILEGHDPATVGQWNLERVRGLLRAADWHRDVIVKANVRLVISIVKKFANPQCGFDDLLSDGIMALIRSVDKFDYQLGFRFSTYATQVVRRHSYRYVMDRQSERLKVANSIGEPGLDVVDDRQNCCMSETRWNTLRAQLGQYLDLLDKREKFIIRARFSLGGHRRVQTLQRLADKLQISKERVRQLEKRALEKLQQMAEVNPPDLVAADA